MANHNEQLDKISLRYVIVTPLQRKEIKRQRTRKLRALRKEVYKPISTKYKGYVA